MQDLQVEPDVVTCCSLVSALERGGQWRLAEQLFCQMCSAAAATGDQRSLLLLQRIGSSNAPLTPFHAAPGEFSPPPSCTALF